MDINGTYLGLSPTDESGVGAGELEVVFTDEVIRYRMATGLEIRSEETSRAELRQLTAEEIAAEFNPDLNPADVAAFTIGDDGPVFLMLLETADYPERVSADAPRVVVFRFVSDEIDAIFGPAFRRYSKRHHPNT